MMQELISSLYKVNAVKRGHFVLKSGQTSSIYVNLREAVAVPSILSMLCESLMQNLKRLDFDLICGVPYGAWPLATALSLMSNYPMLLLRKEPKIHGTQQMVDGAYKEGQRVVLIEDVVTSGGSVLAAKEQLEELGLKVGGVLCVLDREAGAARSFADLELKFFSLSTLREWETFV